MTSGAAPGGAFPAMKYTASKPSLREGTVIKIDFKHIKQECVDKIQVLMMIINI